MQTYDVETWADFQSKLGEFELMVTVGQQQGSIGARVLYRGQADASWNLETTLERYDPNLTSLSAYYRAASAAKPQIEAHTGKEWDIMGWDEYRTHARDSEYRFDLYYPGYNYLAYVRHHGFPSPLLDWTRSPYVAAFFALRNPASSAQRVAVFAYCGDVGHGHAGAIGSPTISSRGPYVTTHRRHFLQQSEYTICTAFRDGRWHYARHQDAMLIDNHNEQDVTWKLTIPIKLRDIVLRYLDRYNLNAYSLLQSEEALMEMVAARELPGRGD